EVTNHDETCGNPDTHLEGLDIVLCLELSDGSGDCKTCPSRALRVVLVRIRIPEIDQKTIAHIFGDEAAIVVDHLGDATVVSGDYLSEILGIDTRRERS